MFSSFVAWYGGGSQALATSGRAWRRALARARPGKRGAAVGDRQVERPAN